MRKFIASVALVCSTLVGAAAPALAVTYAGDPTNLGTFNTSGSVSFESAPGGIPAGTFTNVFSFVVAAGNTATLERSVATTTTISDLSLSLSSSITGTPALNTSAGTTSVPGVFTVAFQNAVNLAAGIYYLLVQGTAPAGATYGGVLELTIAPAVPNPVPLPGALLLMGSVLMGGAGLAKWRKSSSRLAA
jgi:hypothetical protein